MPPIHIGLDGRALATLEGQLAGNSLVPDTATPIAVRLSAGEHRLTVSRSGFSLARGNGGSAMLDAVFLAPAHAPARVLRTLPVRASRARAVRERLSVDEARPSLSAASLLGARDDH